MNKKLLLGADFGTGGCKVTIIDNFGNIIVEAKEEYKTYHPKPSYSEQNPKDWFKALISCLKKVSEDNVNLSDVIAISLDASTHNAVLLDNNMDVIRPTIMWTDQRSVKEVEYLEKEYGQKIFNIAYQKVSPTWTLPQLLWIKNNEPERYKRISKVMFVKDYIRYLLTGSWETDYIEAQGTLMFDMNKFKWSADICNIIGLPMNVLPPLCKPTDVTGYVSKEAAEITGLIAGIPVVCGTSDSAVEDYGAGAIKPGQCILKLATAGNVNVMTDKPYPNPLTLTYSHVVPGMWYTVVATNTAASAMRWFRDNFCFEEVEQSRKSGENVYEIIERATEDIPIGSNGLIFHPYLLGERAPYWDSNLKASFTGATMAHKKGHFIKSLMEGVAFSLRDCYRVIEDMKLEVSEFIIIGGGSRSNYWPQIISDVFGERVLKPVVSDASYGSALLAGVGTGLYSDVVDAVKKCTRIERVYEPKKENNEKYKELFKFYLDIHDNLKNIYAKLNQVIEKE